MKLFLMLLVGASCIVQAQTSPRSGVFSSTSPKSNVGLTFQTNQYSSIPLEPQYGSGFFIPNKGGVTSIVNDVKIETVKTYPNPSSTTVNLEFSTIVNKVKIFDIKGTLVYTSEIETSKIVCDVSGFPSGLYRVVAIGNSDQYVSTFFVSK